MGRPLAWVLALATLASPAAPLAAAQAGKSRPMNLGKFRRAGRPLPNRYIVVLDRSRATASVRDTARSVARSFRGKVGFIYEHALHGFSVELTESTAQALSRLPWVSYVEEDSAVTVATTQLQPPWGLDRIDQRARPLDQAYRYGPTGKGVHAYVVDTGIRFTHGQFGGRASGSFDAFGSDASDCHGHGTHVAGILGGATFGIAKEATLHSVRVLDCSGAGTNSSVIAGVDWITFYAQRPAVANMSLSGEGSMAVNDAVSRSVASGLTYVVAAGNFYADACLFSPASAPGAITVAATDANDARAWFSNFGGCVDIFAPGVGILSSFGSSDFATVYMDGTSQASPHVAGAAARYLQVHPDASPAMVGHWLLDNATTDVVSDPFFSPNRLLFVLPPPGSPTSLTAQLAAATQVRLGWTDNSSRESGYLVQRRTESGAFTNLATLPANTTTYLDSAVTEATAYRYRVYATSGETGASDASNEVSLVTTLNAPTGLTAVPSSRSSIRLTWTDTSAVEDSIRVDRASGSSFVQVAALPANTTQYEDLNLPPAVTESYRIRACRGSVCSAGSNVASATPPEATAEFVLYSSTVREGATDGIVSVPVRLITSDGAPIVSPVSVRLAPTGGSALLSPDGCVTGDFAALTTTLTFPVGTASGSSAAAQILICDDTLHEANETSTLSLSNPSGAVLGSQAVHTVTILDNDPAPTLSINDVSVSQGASVTTNAAFTVSLSTVSGAAATVSYSTANGTATAGHDYTDSSGTLTLPPGALSLLLSVPVLPEAANEPPENFFVRLTNPSEATIAIGLGQATVLNNVPTDLAITKTDGHSTIAPGTPVTYTITVTNPAGSTSVPAERATVTDILPSTITGVTWTCAGGGGGSCGASGTGNISDSVTLPVGASATYTLTGAVSASATGNLVNTASVVPGNGRDAVPGDNSATDTDVIGIPVDLSITKTDGLATVLAGQALTYTIVATNTGPNPVTGATLSDSVPTQLTGATWTCTGGGGGTCAASGSGSISDNTVSLPVGGTVTYALRGTVSPSPAGLVLANQATVAVPRGMADTNSSNDTATDTDLVFCGPETTVIPDGRIARNAIPARGAQTFGAFLVPGASYSIEVKSVSGVQSPGILTVYTGDDACGTASTASVRDTTAIDPTLGNAGQRVSFTVPAGVTAPHYRMTLVNGSSSPIPYQLSLNETTMQSASWSTYGTFDTYYSFRNTTGATINATLTQFDVKGAVVGSPVALAIPARATASTNTVALMTTRNLSGTTMFVHDGPPGAILAEADIADFTLTAPYVQRIKFQAQRELR